MSEDHLPLIHLNLTVADPDRSIAFYRRWFGFTGEPRTYPDGTVFVSNADRFDLALHAGNPGDPPAPAVHFGFRAASPEPVRRLHRELAAAGITITDHHDLEGHVSVKCLDPDGYEIEVYWE